MNEASIEIANALMTLVAAFAGAWAAFKLETSHKNAEEDQRNIAAGNRALLTLMQQANSLKLFQVDFIDPVRASRGRHIQMMASLPLDDGPTQNLQSLDFLSKPSHQQVIFNLSVEQNRYREAIKAINTRSAHHSEVIQPLLEAAGIKEGLPYTGDEFRSAVGERNYLHLQRITDSVVYHVDRTVESICAMRDQLRNALAEMYPKATFVNFELVVPPAEATD